ncbi:MAG TPA: hypothetical protein VGA78_16885 [Gemmatimonadales bacterium]
MTGFVFHPGHHELHGVTVVLETITGVTYVARFDTQDEAGVHLLNVAQHDPATAAMSLDDFLTRTLRFGVKAERKHLVVPAAEVAGIRKLVEEP